MIAPILASGTSAYGQKPLARKGAGFAAALDKAMTDQVQISGQATKMQSDERAQLLTKVRGRMQAGYYNSDIVIEDLSDVLAKVLNDRI